MHYLLVNDDGVDAPGLCTLAKALEKRGDVVAIVAPNTERSGSSHGITIQGSIDLTPVELPGVRGRAYGISGTPADCVRVGLHLFPRTEMVLSGINRGLNLGVDTLYSGTVSAALEAGIYGKGSLAISAQCIWATGEIDYDRAAEITTEVLDRYGAFARAKRAILSLNIPYEIADDTVRLVPIGEPAYYRYDVKENEGVVTPQEKIRATPDGTRDRGIVEAGGISLTPLHFDLTDHNALEKLLETER